MKRLCLLNQNNTKRGVASLYVVIFATILFGVVTLSFMRIILSEAGQTSDDDLSRSAYDSAMAGVEDAKTAVNRCLTNGNSNPSCQALFSTTDCQNGIAVAKVLYGDSYGSAESGWEVKIQENSMNQSSNNNSDQAYTCVVLSDEVPDYRGTLTSDTRTKMIPLAVYDGKTANTRLAGANKIRFEWYSLLNQGDNTDFKLANDKELSNSATLPPTITLTVIKMSAGVDSNSFNNANDTDKLTYDTLVLLPSNSGINSVGLGNSGNVNKAENNAPTPVKCDPSNTEFACHIDITGLPALSATDSLFLVASLPYGDAVTDFAASIYNNDSSIPLKGAQISVDSTGRTNQLVRRVETRLDPLDLYFPYPQYELELSGTGDGDGVNKDFWITANCWQSSNGSAQSCDNNAKIK